MAEDFEPVNPLDVIPGYEQDLSAVGTNRVADPALIAAEEDWSVFHPEIAAELEEK